MDRRVPFFAVVALVCFALIPVSDDSFDQVPLVVGCVYTVLTVLFLLDWLGRRNN